MSDVTQVLSRMEQGDPTAAEQLLPLVYDELRKLAVARLAREKPGQTLQATALVHEAYLRIAGAQHSNLAWDHRGHFFAAAAEAMRRILVDQARRKKSGKGGGGRLRIAWDEVKPPEDERQSSALDLIALSDALDQFAAVDPQKAELVKLRYFAGLSLEDAADVIGVSPATAKRYWVYARSWLYGKLSPETR